MRLFVAVPIPEEIKKKIVDIQKDIGRIGYIKVVEKENLHFTLKFLGDVAEDKICRIEAAIERACESIGQFDIHIAGIGAFPDKNYMRVIWLSVKEGLEELKSLMKAVNLEVSREGFREEEISPHLTIARVRSERSNNSFLKILEKMEEAEIGKMRVNEIRLIKSTLTRAGPVYEEVCSVKLE